MKRITLTLITALALICGMARAASIDMTFDQSVLSGAAGTMLQFSGMLFNTTGTDLFLNADNFNLAGFDLNAIDDSPILCEHADR